MGDTFWLVDVEDRERGKGGEKTDPPKILIFAVKEKKTFLTNEKQTGVPRNGKTGRETDMGTKSTLKEK